VTQTDTEIETGSERSLIEGQPVLIVVDIQGGAPTGAGSSSIPFMPGYQQAMDRAPALVAAARDCGVPIVFFQEAHRRDLVDFGRELDGAEGVHLLAGCDAPPTSGSSSRATAIRCRTSPPAGI